MAESPVRKAKKYGKHFAYMSKARSLLGMEAETRMHEYLEL